MQFDLTGVSQPTVSISSASNRFGRRRWLGLMALTSALSVTLAGTAIAAPVKGGAANLAMVGEPQGLDPMTSTADLVGTIMQHVYEPLYTFDANWNIAPMLAESMPVVSKDGLTYLSLIHI